MRRVALGNDHEASSVLIEAMDDTRPLDAADAGQARSAMGDQGVDQCAGGVANGRVNDEALWLVDHDDRFVFVNNGEGDDLALRGGGFQWGERHWDGIARLDGCRGIADRAPRKRPTAATGR